MITALALISILCFQSIQCFTFKEKSYGSRVSFLSSSERESSQTKTEGPRLVDFDLDELNWTLSLDPASTSRRKRLKTKVAARVLRWEAKRQGQPLPPVLVPSSPEPNRPAQLLLEAFHNSTKETIARIGFTAETGPPLPISVDTFNHLLSLAGRTDLLSPTDYPPSCTSAAVLHVWVHPDYRSNDIGKRGIRIVSYIHAQQSCDLTVLVANDSGSGKLVHWYEKQGFVVAPELDTILGTPDGVYGSAMVAATSIGEGLPCEVKWW